MSTKIYYAWRIPKRRLNDFIDTIRPQAFDEAAKIVRNLMSATKDEAIQALVKEHYSEPAARFKLALDLVNEISKQNTRAVGIDIDFGLNIWIKGNWAYIIPIGEHSFFKNFKIPTWAQDYSYWDNTEGPKHLTQGQWTQRANMWESINCGTGYQSHNARRLYHSVIDFYHRYGDFDAEMELRNRILKGKLI